MMLSRVVGLSVAMQLILGGILFGAAGRWDLPWVWAYLLGWLVYTSAAFAVSAWRHPDLLRERMTLHEDRDRVTQLGSMLPWIAHLVVAGLDVGRFGWSHVSNTMHLLGFAAMTFGWGFIAWTFATNRFASSAVRIQADRGHTVITTGPYAVVRHPMYLGVVAILLGSGPALGSWWAVVAISPMLALFARRTMLEDRMLKDELPGYGDYAQRTRWRVIPGVW